MKKIIYPTDDGISVLTLISGSAEEIAKKDVPTGVKYKIIDASDLPKERDFRNAWEFDFSKDFDGVGE